MLLLSPMDIMYGWALYAPSFLIMAAVTSEVVAEPRCW